jgi:hypothetical protein
MKDTDIEEYFNNEENSALVNSSLFDLYRASIVTHDFSDRNSNSFIEISLVYLYTLSSIYQSHIFVNGIEKFQFGVELEKKEIYFSYYEIHKNTQRSIHFSDEFELRNIKEIAIKDSIFNVFTINHYEDPDFLMFIVVPVQIMDFSGSIKKIFSLAYNYYSQQKNSTTSNYFPLFTNLKTRLKENILSYPYKGKIMGVIAHFEFDDISPYCSLLEEEFAKNIGKSIRQTIQKKLKKTDALYTLSPISYLAYLPDCEVTPVVQRFEDLFFKIDPIMIQYNLKFYEIKPSNVNDYSYLDKILGNEISVVHAL